MNRSTAFASRFARLATAPLVAAALLAACTTATPYQPVGTHGSQARGGYSEQRIAENRYRVTFTGNELTSRQTVENYLLYRAAELTIQAGYDGFTEVRQATDPNTRTTVSDPFGPFGPGPWGYWGPSWRYHGGLGGWHSWYPWGADPFWGDTVDVNTVTSFEASAEIVMFRGRHSDDPRSFDAHEVIQYLGPTIQLPTK